MKKYRYKLTDRLNGWVINLKSNLYIMKYEDLIKISDPYTVYTKFKNIYPCDSEIRISTRKNKKFMIYDPEKSKWFHFGSTMTDWTRHGDIQRRMIFLRRNQKWSESDMYTPSYASYNLLW